MKRFIFKSLAFFLCLSSGIRVVSAASVDGFEVSGRLTASEGTVTAGFSGMVRLLDENRTLIQSVAVSDVNQDNATVSHYAFSDVTPGAYTLSYVGVVEISYEPHVMSAEQSVTVSAENLSVDLQAAETDDYSKLTITVNDQDFNGIADATVTIYPKNEVNDKTILKTSQWGEALFACPHDESVLYIVEISRKGYITKTYPEQTLINKEGANYFTKNIFAELEKDENATATVAGTVSLKGRPVTFHTNVLRITPDDGAPYYAAVTNGRFEVENAGFGGATLAVCENRGDEYGDEYVVSENLKVADAGARIDIAADMPELAVELVIIGATVKGKVVDADGLPVEYAKVTIDNKDAFTNDTGVYAISGIAAGTHPIVATADGFTQAEAMTLTVDFDLLEEVESFITAQNIVMSGKGNGETVKTVEMPEAGMLSELLPPEDRIGLKALAVKGQMNGSDILVLRILAGSDIEGNKTDTGTLEWLDLSEVEIVSGGDPYFMFSAIEEMTTEDHIIGDYMFASCHTLKTVFLPEDITVIGQSAFEGTASLDSVKLGDKIQRIESLAFGESGLQKIVLPESVDFLGDMVFYNCQSLLSADLQAARFDTLDFSTFYFCKNLKEIVLPATLTTIGDNAFFNCTALERIDIPANVSSLSSSAFTLCANLKEIAVPEANRQYASENGILFNKDKSILLTYPVGKTDVDYTVPASVKKIGASAFFESNLESVEMTGVEAIDAAAFFLCKKLEEVTLSGNLHEIGNEAFFSCLSLMRIELPKSLERIGNDAFTNTAIYKIEFPEKIKELPPYCISENQELEEVSLPAGLTFIGEGAFKFCSSLRKITCRATVPPTLDAYDPESVFKGVDSTVCELAVPEKAVETYKKTAVWNRFLHISGLPDTTAVEPLQTDRFGIVAQNGSILIQNLEGLMVNRVNIYNTNGVLMNRFVVNSRDELVLPVNARHTVLIIRLVTEKGPAVYKTYLP